ncbi:tetratricopeptide repeat protein [Salibacter halophilus]|uniref:Tetratricopeptide repeat protein n=1 Tax=Salibacter halophilus TaxID=1803916 RepID=A0A6N6M2X8_9FLAO|nr:tetratricopeptide repeat protein [Salibacter halophilus]KAB1063500.1 tetratricopeptide repeat protein [Salibacter halophilus]
MKFSGLQIIIILSAVAIGAALFFARTTPNEKEVAAKQKVEKNVEDQSGSTGSESDINAQIDSALTKVRSEAPMAGIMKLREIAENNPENIRVQMELGALSIQTGQLDKAVTRFKRVIELDTNFIEAHYLLAVVNANKGDTLSATKGMEFVVDNAGNPELLKQGKEFYKELKKN